MDYQKASSIRKKSLLSLIAQNKFEQGQGLGSSIGTAISDKFKAKAVGIKEKFDPLNWVSAITGKGTFGKVATTLAGRAFGRSDEAVEYFGGYARKNKKDDPQRTNIGPGRVVPLRVGDSTADILAKMYNLSKISFEKDKTQKELEVAFRKEQMEEDERRHKKLIDELLKSYGKKGKRPEVTDVRKDTSLLEDVEEFFGKFIEKLKSVLSAIMAPIKLILSAVSSAFKALFVIVKDITGLIGKTVLSAVSSLGTFLIGSMLSILTPALETLTTLTVKSTLKGVFSKLPGWLGTTLGTALGLYFADEALDAEKKLLQNLMPNDVIEEMKEGSGSDYDKARQKYNKSIQSGLGTESAKKDFDNERLKLQERVDKHIKEDIEPIAKAAGYSINYEDRDKLHSKAGLTGGIELPTVYTKGKSGALEQVSTGAESLAIMAAGLNKMEDGLDILKGKTEKLEKRIGSSLEGTKQEIGEKFETGKMTVLNKLNIDLPSIKEVEEKLNLNKDSNTIINNSLGGKSEVIDPNKPPVRNNDETLNQCQRGSTAKC